ncbi:MAG: hypothetical protein IJ449_09540 [Clostridia bacterium]|nr:hypothetical protein [Clostridia bacterium]
MKTPWYTNCYRRNLVDMHIEDWDERFLSEFSPETYAENLKLGRIEAPMLYLQSHVGHCYFPTKVGHTHRAFTGSRADGMRRLVDLCLENGMHPVGYYSLIYNTVEADRHPDWQIVDANGKSRRDGNSRYGLCCPNNEEYRAFVLAQIEEMAEYFPNLEGMFYDMTFWPDICHCPACKEKYRLATGKTEFPAVNWNDPDFRAFNDLRTAWLGDFARLVTEKTKAMWNGISVEHNYANAVASDSSLTCSSEIVNEQCDYTGGDLYGDLYNHSFTAKYFYGVTKHQPFEYMTCRCDRTLYAHTNSKTEETLAVEVMLTAAHHGASFVIDAIDPVGTLDRRVYDRIGKVFERQIPYEMYFYGEMLSDVGVYYATTGRFNTSGQSFDNKKCAVSATKTLIEAHIPVSVISNAATGNEKTAALQCILAPQIAGITAQNCADLIRYVENGGTLYLSGAEEPELLSALIGASLKEYTASCVTYLAPTAAGKPYFGEFNEKYPLPIEGKLPILENFADCEILATLTLPYTTPGQDSHHFASIHSNPPGVTTDIPVLVKRSVGAGQVIWSAAPIAFDQRRSHRNLLLSLLSEYLTPTVTTTAPRGVEIVTFRAENELLLNAVDLLATDELLPRQSFGISVRSEAAPKKIIRVGGKDEADEEIPFTYENGQILFAGGDMVIFAMYHILF